MPEILGRLRPPRLAGAPASPANGEMYYDTGTNKLYWWNGTTWVDSSGGGGGTGGHTIQDEGSALPARTGLNFVGAGVTAADDSANGRTNVTIPGSGATMTARMYRQAAATLTTGWQKIALDSVGFDTSGLASIANNRINISQAGYYQVDAVVVGISNATNQYFGCSIYKNGVSAAQQFVTASVSGVYVAASCPDVVYCNAGDYLELWAYTNTGAPALNSGTGSVYFSAALLTSLPGAVGTTTPARAYRNAAFTTSAGANAKVPVDTISFDPGGNISTANGRYVCPATGYYQVNGQINANATAAGQTLYAMVYKNGTIATVGSVVVSNAVQSFASEISDTVFCNAGDYLELWAFCTNALTLAVSYWNCYLSVSQVGNLSSVGAPTSTMVARMYRNAALTGLASGWNRLPMDTISFDTSGLAQPTNGRMVATVTGYYDVTASSELSVAAGADSLIAIYVNGTERSRGDRGPVSASAATAIKSVEDRMLLNAGDFIEAYTWSSAGYAISETGAASMNYLSMNLISSLPGAVGPTTPARACRGSNITTSAGSGFKKVPLDTINFDPGGNFNVTTQRYTCPATGTYSVSGNIAFTCPSAAGYIASLYKNGNQIQQGPRINTSGAGQLWSLPVADDLVQCNAGDYLELYLYDGSGATQINGDAPGAQTFMSVVQVGNQMATPASTACARMYRTAALSPSTGFTKIPLDTISFDTSGIASTANGRINIPVAGYYDITAEVDLNVSGVSDVLVSIYVNGAERVRGDRAATPAAQYVCRGVADKLLLNAGDYVELYVYSSVATYSLVDLGFATNYLSLALLTPLSGAVGPVTAARSYRNAALSIPATTATKIPIDTVSSDPGNNISTANGRYVCPATGTYDVSAVASPVATGAGQYAVAYIYKNGVLASVGSFAQSTGAITITTTVADKIQCNAGDYLELWVFTSVAMSLSIGAYQNSLAVVQVGNSFTFTTAGGDLAGSYPNPTLAAQNHGRVAIGALGYVNGGPSNIAGVWSALGSGTYLTASANGLTVTRAGVYMFVGKCRFDGATGNRFLYVTVNTVQNTDSEAGGPNSSLGKGVISTFIGRFNAGDVVSLAVWQDSGATQSIGSAVLNGYRIGN